MNTFNDFLANKLANDVASTLINKGYSTNEELLEYLISSGVRLPIPDVIEYVDEFVTKRKLPSRYQINDLCSIVLADFLIKKARVIKVHFTESKAFYDLEVEITIGKKQLDYTRIYNVDSAYLTDFKEDITEVKNDFGHITD